MEITKREVILSIAIVAIMLILGFFISDNIAARQDEKNAEFQKAIQINDTELFKHGMNTNVGNAFVYGDLKAIDTVTYPDIEGDYMYIEKVKEEYTMHTRTVTTTVNGKTSVRVETYWTWDVVDRENKSCKKISFCGVEFNSNKIKLPGSEYIDTIKESSHIRYKYYGVDTEYKGTIYTSLKDKTISDKSRFYNNANIEKALEISTSNVPIVWFWILWIILTIVIVCGFYYIDNRWLE